MTNVGWHFTGKVKLDRQVCGPLSGCRATVGEISGALERVWGRYEAGGGHRHKGAQSSVGGLGGWRVAQSLCSAPAAGTSHAPLPSLPLLPTLHPPHHGLLPMLPPCDLSYAELEVHHSQCRPRACRRPGDRDLRERDGQRGAVRDSGGGGSGAAVRGGKCLRGLRLHAPCRVLAWGGGVR